MPSTPPSGGGELLDPQLLERYWLGNSSAEEVAYLEAWFETSPDRRTWYEQMRHGIKADGWIRLSPCELSARTEAIERAIGIHAAPALSRHIGLKRHALHRGLRQAMWYVVSGAVVAAVFLILGWQSGMHRLSTTLSARTSTYATANGQRATITLPDGSTVLLNVASQLQVPADYAAGDRTVSLTGEALFAVAHHTGAPFTVVAGRSTTRVLGTSFVVRHYAMDTAAVVAVREGRVAVEIPAGHGVVVTAAEQIAVSPRGLGRVRPAESADFSFTDGMLTLNDVPLPAAIAELDRWYDVDIRLGDPTVATKEVAGEWAAGTVGDLAAILEGTLNVRVVQTGRVLTLFTR